MRKKIYLIIFLLVTLNLAAQNQTLSEKWADSVMSKMTVDERIGQLFIMYAYSNGTAVDDSARLNEIRAYHPGGVLFMQGNPNKQVELTNLFQNESTIPLFIAIDGEWGLSMRLKNTVKYPRQMTLGALRNERLIYDFGLQVGREMNRMGIHINFAPDVDVNVNKLNPVINTRSFGDRPQDVARKGIEYMRGMQDAGIIAVAKHFPGHGNTSLDSHYDLPEVNHNLKQINELDLYPFKALINEGVKGILTGHLWVPALTPLDSLKRASSLSYDIVTGLLRDSMGFQGLIFTDGMGMSGVHINSDSVYKDAILAGNDMILFPPKIKEAVLEVKNAVLCGSIPEEVINQHCRRILINKYQRGLSVHSYVKPEGVDLYVNSPEAQALNERLIQESIIVVKNNNGLIPFSDSLLMNKQTLVLLGGSKGDIFENTCQFYRDVNVLRYSNKPNDGQIAEAIKSSANDSVVIIVLYAKSKISNEALEFIEKVSSKKKVVLCVLSNPYALGALDLVMSKISVLVVGFDFADLYQRSVAQVLFGGASASGAMPISVLKDYPIGTGIITNKNRLGFSSPENQGMSSIELKKIDSVVNKGIAGKAMPGCQIIVARHGEVVFDRNFGYYTYDRKVAVNDADLYDLASVTKISATLPSVMRLIEANKLSLSDTLGGIFDDMKGTDKSNITIRDILYHESGLPSFIPMANLFIDTSKLGGQPLFSRKKDNVFTLKVEKNFYGNKNRSFESTLFSNVYSDKYSLEVAKGLFANCSVEDSMWYAIVHARLGIKKYVYSDLNFLILQRVVEKYSGERLNDFVNDNFYRMLNGGRTTYLPLKEFSIKRVAPTEQENFFRRQLLQGYVHDMNAALMGGVAGHAGMFSSARDIAKLMQMYLNNGFYGTTRYFKTSTIQEFAQTRSADSRRGLGFDKPELDKKKVNPVAEECSSNSFGHSGFTGTLVWVDPDKDLVYVFLSNRVYPEAYNHKLITMGIRTEIQKIIYDSISKGSVPLGNEISISPLLGNYQFQFSSLSRVTKEHIRG